MSPLSSAAALKRRAFLKLTGAGLGLAAMPSIHAAAAKEADKPVEPESKSVVVSEKLMPEVCAYLQKSASAELPAAVILKTKHHLLDTLAAIVSGAEFKVGKLSSAFVRAQGGGSEACIAGTNFLATAINAAFAHGNMAHADETDDSHERSSTHPGCAIIPAALAMAERQNASGLQLIRGVVAGYDLGTRFNFAFNTRQLEERNHASHSVGGGFGAAAASASILRFDETKIRFLIDYTGQQASGIRYYVRDTEHVEKSYVFGGLPAHGGAMAAMMVEAGFTGVMDCLSGENNLFQTFSETPAPDLLVEGLGSRYEIMATNIKKFSVGSPIQAPVEALTRLIERHQLTRANVKAVSVRVPSFSVVNNRDMPDINLQYCLAATLLDGTLSFQAAHDFARISSPEVKEIWSRFTLTEDRSLRRPETSRTALVEVTRNDGEKFSEHVIAVPGTAQNPMTTEQVEAKATDILVPVIGAARAKQLIAAVWNLDQLGSVRELRPLLGSTA
jgi:2-methylcitrate dehydratase PrpD